MMQRGATLLLVILGEVFLGVAGFFILINHLVSIVKNMLVIIASPEPRPHRAGGAGKKRLKLPTMEKGEATYRIVHGEALVNLIRKPRTFSPRKFINKFATLRVVKPPNVKDKLMISVAGVNQIT